jgi:hypothetical protein
MVLILYINNQIETAEERNLPFVQHGQNLPDYRTPSQSVTKNGICPESFCFLGREDII